MRHLQVGFTQFRKVEVDDHVHGLNVNAACEQIRADKIAAETGAEIVEHSVAMILTHFRMDIVAWITKISDFLGEEFDTLCWITENNRLIDLELGGGSERDRSWFWKAQGLGRDAYFRKKCI